MLVADPEVGFGGGGAVDGDLAAACGQRPATEARPVRPGVGHGEAELRRAVDAEHLAVAVDQLGGALDAAAGRARRRDAGDLVDEARTGTAAAACRGRRRVDGELGR